MRKDARTSDWTISHGHGIVCSDISRIKREGERDREREEREGERERGREEEREGREEERKRGREREERV